MQSKIESWLKAGKEDILASSEPRKLDFYVLCNVLLMSPEDANRFYPTTKFQDLKMVFLYVVNNVSDINVSYTELNKEMGIKAGMFEKTWIPKAFKVACGDVCGYGYSYEMAFVKFAISWYFGAKK